MYKSYACIHIHGCMDECTEAQEEINLFTILCEDSVSVKKTRTAFCAHTDQKFGTLL